MVVLNSEGANVYTVATGTLNDDDYDEMLPLIRKKIEVFGKVNWYFQMKDFEGWTPHAFWRDLKFDVQDADKLGRVAIVGEKKWQEIMTEVMDVFTKAEIRYFDEGDAQAAKKWVAG